jgi:hypothetical protein
MRTLFLAGAFASILSVHAARADGLIYRLPADGTSATFDLEMTGSVNGREKTDKLSMSVSSVGAVTVDGEKCRWIEFKMFRKDKGLESPAVTKLLIPEKNLGKQQNAGEHIIRGWATDGEGEPVAITDLNSLMAGFLSIFVAGPSKTVRELEKADVVNEKLGRLPCVGVAGEQDFDQSDVTIRTNFEHRLHDDAPFGVVSAFWKLELNVAGHVVATGTMKLTLTDVNATALSELLNKN